MQINVFNGFLAAVATVFSAIILLLAGFNYYHDPANLFGDRTYEAGVAKILLEGKNVANVTNYDERLLQKNYVANLRTQKDILVLGSSRSMNIGASIFPEVSLFNSSVSGATLEDFYAILQLYRDRGLQPKRVILGIDPWMFNRNNGQTRWKSLEHEYRRSTQFNIAHLDNPKNSLSYQMSRLLQLVSYEYFIASWKSKDGEAKHYFPTTATELDVNIRLSDGTIAYPHEITNRTDRDVVEVVRRQLAKVPLYSLGNFTELDMEYILSFKNLIKGLQSEGVSITLFVPPYHHDMYEAIMRTGSPYLMVDNAEKFLVGFALENHIELVGSYNPDNVLCGRSDFFDEMHPRPACVERVFSKEGHSYDY